MTSFTTNIRDFAPTKLRPIGERIMGFLIRVAENSPNYRAIQHYNAMSDAELAELGMTRADVAHRIFGARMGL
jgi:uncharacterized protein YjiS (DUF1127 family)